MRTSLHMAVILLLLLHLRPSFAEEKPTEKRWWEKREERSDLYYPHKRHFDVMKEEGDPCMRCHPFSGNTVTDLDILDKLNVIANEPLESICHSCHVVELTAPSQCRLCHKEIGKIRPESHGSGYVENHGFDARRNGSGCAECHISPSFCTDCHFRRERSRERIHGAGYRSSHGIEARLSPGRCGKCHSERYCRDCHEKMR